MANDIIDNIKDSVEEVAEDVEEIIEDAAEEGEEIDKEIAEDLAGEEVKDAVRELSGEELEKAAEAESIETKEKPKKKAKSTEKTLEEKKKELAEKIKKLKGKVEVTTTEELKKEVKGKKKGEPLLPLDDYVKSGIYLGTRVVTPEMRPFVYRRRADGLAIFNTDLIDEKLKEGIEYLSGFEPSDVIVVCKRAAGWRVVEMFSKLTGIRAFTKKYPAGILTNTDLDTFFEAELALIVDSWLDKNAVADVKKVKKKILMVCDTNNFSSRADEFVIGNNKSSKSLGLIFYLLTKGYCKARKLTTEKDIPELDWWIGDGVEGEGAEFGV